LDRSQEPVDGQLVRHELEIVVLEDGPSQEVGLVGGQRGRAQPRRAVGRDVDAEAERVRARDEAVAVDDFAEAAALLAGELVGLAEGELVVLVGLAAKFFFVFFWKERFDGVEVDDGDGDEEAKGTRREKKRNKKRREKRWGAFSPSGCLSLLNPRRGKAKDPRP
jgi:hypothetical protein